VPSKHEAWNSNPKLQYQQQQQKEYSLDHPNTTKEYFSQGEHQNKQ
jgi:hypothetical protein